MLRRLITIIIYIVNRDIKIMGQCKGDEVNMKIMYSYLWSVVYFVDFTG